MMVGPQSKLLHINVKNECDKPVTKRPGRELVGQRPGCRSVRGEHESGQRGTLPEFRPSFERFGLKWKRVRKSRLVIIYTSPNSSRRWAPVHASREKRKPHAYLPPAIFLKCPSYLMRTPSPVNNLTCLRSTSSGNATNSTYRRVSLIRSCYKYICLVTLCDARSL